MTNRDVEIKRWLCEMYNNRGLGLPDAAWPKFAAFCEQNGFTDEPLPGRRLDGQDPWDVLQDKWEKK